MQRQSLLRHAPLLRTWLAVALVAIGLGTFSLDSFGLGSIDAVPTGQRAPQTAPPTALAALANGLRPTYLRAGEPLPRWSLAERMRHYAVPGVAVAIVAGGEVVAAAGYGVRGAGSDERVDADTLFNVGSISKVAAAAVSLRLVETGRLDLDRDINTYLTSWQLPATPSVARTPVVTLRMLMSHTAGLTVHGFPDYEPGERLPTLLDTLEGRPPAQNAAVRLEREPGLLSDYSGGGITIEQLVIEDVTGASLEQTARLQLFAPLGMPRSTFENPLPASRGNIAKAHDAQGRLTGAPRGWQTFPQEAAAGLWTTASELGGFAAHLIKSYQGRDAFLSQAMALRMMTEVAPSWHGLGPRLDGAGSARIFHHGGANDGYRAWLEGYLETGDGFVILTNGANGTALANEIRNALSDAIALGVNPVVRAVSLPPGLVARRDYAGRYRLDEAVPMDLRRALTDVLEVDALSFLVNGEQLSVQLPDETGALWPLSPSRFVAPTVFGLQFQFHRDAHGAIRGVTVDLGGSRAYFRREPLTTAKAPDSASNRIIRFAATPSDRSAPLATPGWRSPRRPPSSAATR